MNKKLNTTNKLKGIRMLIEKLKTNFNKKKVLDSLNASDIFFV